MKPAHTKLNPNHLISIYIFHNLIIYIPKFVLKLKLWRKAKGRSLPAGKYGSTNQIEELLHTTPSHSNLHLPKQINKNTQISSSKMNKFHIFFFNTKVSSCKIWYLQHIGSMKGWTWHLPWEWQQVQETRMIWLLWWRKDWCYPNFPVNYKPTIFQPSSLLFVCTHKHGLYVPPSSPWIFCWTRFVSGWWD